MSLSLAQDRAASEELLLRLDTLLARDEPVGQLLDVVESFLGAASSTRKWQALGSVEEKVERDLEKAFARQGEEFLKRFAGVRHLLESLSLVEAEVAESDWSGFFDAAASATEDDFDLALAPIGGALALGAKHRADELGVTFFNVAHPAAYGYLADNAAELVAGINKSTRDDLRTIITNGARLGQSYDKIAAQITKKYAQFSTPQPQLHIRSRAHLIAVNELGKAYEAGGRMQVDRMAGNGLLMEKEWMTVSDSRVDWKCGMFQDMGFIPHDKLWDGIEYPPAHPACRCTVKYQRKKDQCRATFSHFVEAREGIELAEAGKYYDVPSDYDTVTVAAKAAGVYYSQVTNLMKSGKAATFNSLDGKTYVKVSDVVDYYAAKKGVAPTTPAPKPAPVSQPAQPSVPPPPNLPPPGSIGVLTGLHKHNLLIADWSYYRTLHPSVQPVWTSPLTQEMYFKEVDFEDAAYWAKSQGFSKQPPLPSTVPQVKWGDAKQTVEYIHQHVPNSAGVTISDVVLKSGYYNVKATGTVNNVVLYDMEGAAAFFVGYVASMKLHNGLPSTDDSSKVPYGWKGAGVAAWASAMPESQIEADAHAGKFPAMYLQGVGNNFALMVDSEAAKMYYFNEKKKAATQALNQPGAATIPATAKPAPSASPTIAAQKMSPYKIAKQLGMTYSGIMYAVKTGKLSLDAQGQIDLADALKVWPNKTSMVTSGGNLSGSIHVVNSPAPPKYKPTGQSFVYVSGSQLAANLGLPIEKHHIDAIKKYIAAATGAPPNIDPGVGKVVFDTGLAKDWWHEEGPGKPVPLKPAVGGTMAGGQACMASTGNFKDFATDAEGAYWLNKWKHPPVNATQARALADYQGAGYTSINGHLRLGYQATTSVLSKIKSMDGALKQHRLPEDVVLIRGCGKRAFSDLGVERTDDVDTIRQKLLGKIATDPGFVSTSAGKHPAGIGAVKDLWIKFSAPAGTPALQIDHAQSASAHISEGGEREVILPRDMKYVVTKVETYDYDQGYGLGAKQKIIVHATILP